MTTQETAPESEMDRLFNLVLAGLEDGAWRAEHEAARFELERRVNTYPDLVAALTRISKAAPDRLDHAIDIGTIERAASIARAALARAGEGVQP